jgi:hypothetical protein
MAGAQLIFANGYLGFERVKDPKGEKQYLRAVIHNNSTGLTTSAPVEITQVVEFATEAVRQALLADGHDEEFVADLVWSSRAKTDA